jgi:hypothetical protein
MVAVAGNSAGGLLSGSSQSADVIPIGGNLLPSGVQAQQGASAAGREYSGSYEISNASHGHWSYPLSASDDTGILMGFAGSTGGAIGIAKLDYATGLVRKRLLDYIDGQDDHNLPATHLAPDGSVLLAYCGHATETKVYFKRTCGKDSPLEISLSSTLTTSGSVSYTQFIELGADALTPGRVLLFYRLGGSTDGAWAIRWTDDYGRTWSAETIILGVVGATATSIPYANFSLKPGDNSIVRVFAYENPEVGTDHDLYYGFLNFSVTNGAIAIPGSVIANTGIFGGSQIGLPVPKTSLLKARDITTGTQRLSDARRFDAAQTLSDISGTSPAILTTEYTSGVYTNAKLYRLTYNASGVVFKRHLICDVGTSFESSSTRYYSGAAFSLESIDIVYAITNSTTLGVTTYELAEYITPDGGTTWVKTRVLDTSTNRLIRPYMMEDGYLRYSELTSWTTYQVWEGVVKVIKVGAGVPIALNPVDVTFSAMTNLEYIGKSIYASKPGGENSNAVGILTASLPGEGWIEAFHRDATSNFTLAMDATAGDKAFTANDFIAQVNGAGLISRAQNTTVTSTGVTVPDETYVRLIRKNGVVTIEYSNYARTTWTVAYTFAGTVTTTQYPIMYTTFSTTPRYLEQPMVVSAPA